MACDRHSTGNPNADVQTKRCSTILVTGGDANAENRGMSTINHWYSMIIFR